jgi:hypothetical protein
MDQLGFSRQIASAFVLIAATLMASGCQQGGGGLGQATFFHSPLERPRGNPQILAPAALYSNLGEKRATDGPAWTNHGATDFKTGGRRLNVYSPDTGKVRFYGAQVQGHLARNAGLPPVKIGHFAMLHFGNVAQLFVDPRQLRRQLNLPQRADTWWVHVVGRNDPITLGPGGQTTTLGRRRARAGTKRNAQGQWTNVIYYNQEFPIARTHGPDLHVLYYDTKASDYGDRADIRNALSVFNYRNPNPPVIHGLWLFSQNPRQGQSKRLIAGDAPAQARGTLDMALDGGVDVVVSASSFAMNNNNRAGIYRLAYRVDRFLGERELEDPPEGAVTGPGQRQMVPVIPETVMYTYAQVPAPAEDDNLVAATPKFTVPGAAGAQLSQFQAVDGIKRTAYAVTNTNGNDAGKWGLDQIAAFPDGDYLLTVKAWNIGQANGIGNAPTLRDSQLQKIVNVRTAGNNRRLTLSAP